MGALFDSPDPPNPILNGGGADRLQRLDRRSPTRSSNNVNQVTPQGSLTYTDTGSYNWHRPDDRRGLFDPADTATQTLSPIRAGDLRPVAVGATTILPSLGNEQAARLRQQFATPAQRWRALRRSATPAR